MARDVVYTHMVSCRMSDGDYEKLEEKCRRLGIAKSDYLRYLIRLPVDADGDGPRAVVLDTKTCGLIFRELRKQGHNYNQACHALNTIRWNIEHGRLGFEGAHDLLAEALVRLNAAEDERRGMRAAMESIARDAAVGGD